jgi:hypothetical protein
MCFESTDWQRVSIRLISDKSEWTVSFDKEFYRRQCVINRVAGPDG